MRSSASWKRDRRIGIGFADEPGGGSGGELLGVRLIESTQSAEDSYSCSETDVRLISVVTLILRSSLDSCDDFIKQPIGLFKNSNMLLGRGCAAVVNIHALRERW
jgi:hypothetical protein